ncbi:methyltransferase, partial [Burkholderia pseudomallei]
PAAVAASDRRLESKAAILLPALAALGLLTKDGDAYRNTALSARYLTTTSADYIGPIVEHQNLQWDNLPRLGEILRSEEPLAFQQE